MRKSRKWEVIFDPEGLRKKIKELEDASLKEGFWDDQKSAQKVLKEKKSLEDRLAVYERLSDEAAELPELIEIAEELEDEDEAASVIASFEKLYNTRSCRRSHGRYRFPPCGADIRRSAGSRYRLHREPVRMT